MNREEVIRIFSVKIRKILRKQEEHLEEWEEIRLRTGQPLEVICRGKRIYLSEDGEASGWEMAYRVCGEDIRETLEYISRYSRTHSPQRSGRDFSPLREVTGSVRPVM